MNWVEKNEWFVTRSREKVNWRALQRFLSYYGPQRMLLIAAAVASLIGSSAAIAIPLALREIQHSIQVGSDRLLLRGCCLFLAVLLAQNGVSWFVRLVRAKIASRLNSTLLMVYFAKVLNIPTEEFIEFRTNGNMFQRVIDALSVTAISTESLLQGMQGFITIVILLVLLARMDLMVGGLIAVGCGALFLTARQNASYLAAARKRVLAINYPLVGKIIETIEAALIIKTMAATFNVTSDISELVANKREADLHEIGTEARSFSINSMVGSVITVGTLFLVSYPLLHHSAPVSRMLAVYVLAGLCISPVVELANLYQALPALSLTVSNYLQTLDMPDDNAPGQQLLAQASTPIRQTLKSQATAGASISESIKPAIRGSHVEVMKATFAYKNSKPVFEQLHLEIMPGEHIGLVGRSGSGKTTLFRLLLGLLHPQSGQVLVDGISPASCRQREAYRSQFGVVSQNDFLFNASISENLTFGMMPGSVEMDELEGTLDSVNLLKKIRQLPEGMATKYYPDTLSGGEKQRLLIARALVRKPKIVLLDEPTSALDFENENLVLGAIEKLTSGRTTITIAHRLSTVRSVDKIIVLEKGRISASGKHDELLETCEYYRDLYRYNSFLL